MGNNLCNCDTADAPIMKQTTERQPAAEIFSFNDNNSLQSGGKTDSLNNSFGLDLEPEEVDIGELEKFKGYILETIDSSRFILKHPQNNNDQIEFTLQNHSINGPVFVGLPQELINTLDCFRKDDIT